MSFYFTLCLRTVHAQTFREVRLLNIYLSSCIFRIVALGNEKRSVHK